MKSRLNKKILLINKKTFTERRSQIIRVGNELYTYRKLYIITKDNLINEIKHKKLSFYLKTKMKIKKDVAYTKPQEEDIIVESYRALIILITNFCEIKDINRHKIMIFNADLHSIESNEQLMNYKDKIIYVKINENIKKNINEENNINSLRTIKKALNKRLSFNIRDDKGNIINHSNPSILFSEKSVKYPLFILKPKKSYNINDQNLNDSQRSCLSKNSSFSMEKNIINSLKSKFIFQKKLSKISLKYSKNSFSLTKEDDENKNNTFKLNSSEINDIIKPKNIRFNEASNNININNSSIIAQLNKSKSENQYFREKNQRLNHKFFDTEKLFNSFNFTKNAGVQVMNMNKHTNKRQNYLYNNFFNNIIKKHNYFTFLSKNKNNSFYDVSKNKDKIFIINNLPESRKMNLSKTYYNKKFLLKNSKEFAELKSVYKYLKYPKVKEQETKDTKKPQNLNLNKLKEIYDECLYEIGIIINDINEYFPDISEFEQQIDYSFLNKHKCLDIVKCLKQYLLYSFIESFIIDNKEISLKSFINIFEDSVTEDNYKKVEYILKFLLDKIIITRENKTFHLINFVQSKRNVEEFLISREFFCSFILSTNYFDKMQRNIGKIMLMTLEIKEQFNYKMYIHYYLYFKDNRSLKLENKLDFINRFLYLLDSGCYEDKDHKLPIKFINDVLFIFRIDERSKNLLLNNILKQNTNMTYSMIRKINNIFYSMINYFGNNFFNTTQIMNLN